MKLELAKFCHHALHMVSFVSLLVPCYLFYMQKAIKDSQQKATTVTKRSEHLAFDSPVIIICPQPNFKPSISSKFSLSIPDRDLFITESDFWEFLDVNFIYNQTVKELYEQFTYNNDFTYLYKGTDLYLGKNEFKDVDGSAYNIDLKKVHTWRSGVCDLIQIDDVENWEINYIELFIGYSKTLDQQDIPKEFTIYLMPNDQWSGIVTESGLYQMHFKVNTKYTFPLYLEVYPLSREFFIPLPSEGEEKNEHTTPTLEYCFKPDDIVEILNSSNCTEICIPVHFSSLFNTEIKTCSNNQAHFCAFYEIYSHVDKQQEYCMTPNTQKYFKGISTYMRGFTNYYPEIIKGGRKDRTLMLFYCGYKSNVTIISEEKLVYDSKDLLAWLGGALGIFVGYSFFDLAKNIIDVAFYFIYRANGST